MAGPMAKHARLVELGLVLDSAFERRFIFLYLQIT
jgi:hypothetical protein